MLVPIRWFGNEIVQRAGGSGREVVKFLGHPMHQQFNLVGKRLVSQRGFSVSVSFGGILRCDLGRLAFCQMG